MATPLFDRIVKVDISYGSTRGSFRNDGDEGIEIRFEVPFDDDADPNAGTVELYNLSKTSRSYIKRGATITVQAGYRADYGVLVTGRVASVKTYMDGVTRITKIGYLEGDDYSRIKLTAKTSDPAEKYTSGKKKGQDKNQKLQIAFKNGTKGSTIIKRLVDAAGIKLDGKIELVRDKVYKKGYVVTGIILNNLEEVVRDCGSVMYHRRGRLVIRPLRKGNDERFTLSEDTGLLEAPGRYESDDEDGYNVSCLLQHRITTASIIRIKSSTANGSYRVARGKHICDGPNTFRTECEVV